MSDSPVKKLNFEPSMDQENIAQDAVPVVLDVKEPATLTTDVVLEKPEAPKVAPTIKEDESDEPLLQENPHRFVLFPIRYNEVRASHASRVKCFCPIASQLTIHLADMANVQKSPSLLLVGRGD